VAIVEEREGNNPLCTVRSNESRIDVPMDEHINQLVQQALAGNEQAFEVIVQLYTKPLYSFVFLVVHERDLAEDIVQETFIKAWKNLKRFNQRRHFKTWLYTIAKNSAFDALKKKKALPFSTFVDQEGNLPFENMSDNSVEMLEVLSREERLRVLDQALAALPVAYRTLLLLVYREDFDLKEAALILNEPYNTVKSRHKRGIAQLQKMMQLSRAPKSETESY
jgi:RNA polymerase sigma-70 factor, ECF subfamily